MGACCGCCRKSEPDNDTPNFEEKLRYNPEYCELKTKGRRPTDIFFLLLYIAHWAGMVYVAYVSIRQGDPARLYLPTDYMGRVCGRDNTYAEPLSISLPRDPACRGVGPANETCQARMAELNVRTDLTDRPYLWFMHPTEPLTYGGECVSYCPGSKDAQTRFCPPQLGQETFPLLSRQYCTHTRVDMAAQFPPLFEDQLIASQLSYASAFKRCIPIPFPGLNTTETEDSIKNATSSITSALGESGEVVARLWGDIFRSYKVIIVSAFVALIFSFVYITLVRWFVAPIVWITIVVLFFVLGGLGGFCLWAGRNKIIESEAKELSTTSGQVIMYTGVGLLCLEIVYVLAILLLFSKVRRGIGIIKEACKAITALPTLPIMPVLLFIVLAIYMAYWIAILVYLWSVGISNQTPDRSAYVFKLEWDLNLRLIFLFHLFGMFWTTSLLIAFTYASVAGAIATWYWSRDKKMRFQFVVMRAAARMFVYHLGSIAFGSFIVALVKLIRFLVAYAEKKIKQAMGQPNAAVTAVFKYVQCMLACMERFIKFINENAYIQIAIYGKPFCTSAKNAALLLIRNAAQIVVIEWMGDFILFLGRVLIAFATAFAAFGLASSSLLTDYFSTEDGAIQEPIFVAFLVWILAFAIASIFMTIFETAIDTILQCFLIDKEMTEEGQGEPFCTESLRKFIDYNKRAGETENCCSCCCCCVTEHPPEDNETELKNV